MYTGAPTCGKFSNSSVATSKIRLFSSKIAWAYLFPPSVLISKSTSDFRVVSILVPTPSKFSISKLALLTYSKFGLTFTILSFTQKTSVSKVL